MEALMETSEVLSKHAELVATNRAKIIDGYCQLYIKKCPKWLPPALYKFILGKVVVLAFFRETH